MMDACREVRVEGSIANPFAGRDVRNFTLVTKVRVSGG